jgi:hypothetical protein
MTSVSSTVASSSSVSLEPSLSVATAAMSV